MKKKIFRSLLSLLTIGTLVLVPTMTLVSCSKGGPSITTYDEAKLRNEFKKINNDNFKQYFIGANNSPYSQNPGRMSKALLGKMLNVDPNKIQSFKFSPSNISDEQAMEDKGMYRIDLSVNFNDGSRGVENNILTGMFDVEGVFNKKYMVVDRNYIKGWHNLPSELYPYFNIGYTPRTSGEGNDINEIRMDVEKNPPNMKKLDFRFSIVEPFLERGIFRDDNYIEEITFNGSSLKGEIGYYNTNNFRDMKKLKSIDFSNTNIYKIPGQTLEGCDELTTILFKNCTKLVEIDWNALSRLPKLETIDFSDSPITTIGSGAFNECINLKTVYVKDIESKKVFEKHLISLGLTNTKVIIKGHTNPQYIEEGLNKLEANFKKVNIDNFKDYFIDADNSPFNQNPGRMSKEILANMMEIEPYKINSFKFSPSQITKQQAMDDKGMYRINIDINFNDGNIVNKYNILTGMFDVEGVFNNEYTGIVGNRYGSGIDGWPHLPSELYPYFNVGYVPRGSNNDFENFVLDQRNFPPNMKKIDCRFSIAEPFLNIGILRDDNQIEEITFNSSPIKGKLGNTATNNFRDMKKLKSIDFSNTNIYKIPGQTLEGCDELTTILFKNCTKLVEIDWNALSRLPKLETIDFSDSPITTIGSGAFNECINLKTVYVKNEASKKVFEDHFKTINLNFVQVIIK